MKLWQRLNVASHDFGFDSPQARLLCEAAQRVKALEEAAGLVVMNANTANELANKYGVHLKTKDICAHAPHWPGVEGLRKLLEGQPDEDADTAATAAAAGIQLLRQARDRFKEAGASRTVARIRLALTSAGGAERNAQNSAARERRRAKA